MNLSLHSSNPTLRRRRRGEISPVSPSPTPTRPNPRSEAPSASSTIRQRRPSPAKPRFDFYSLLEKHLKVSGRWKLASHDTRFFLTVLRLDWYFVGFVQLDDSLFVEIEIGQSVVVDDPDGPFTVKAFDANHCPEEAREHIKSIWDKADLIKILYQGIKAKDVYDLTSSGKGCSKRCREDFTKEKEDLELEEKFAQKLQSMGIPQQFDIDPTTTDGTSRDEEDNSNNNIEVENDFESDSEED
nr:hypothetical protein CFP56_28235 [Quercus suber]